MTPVPVSQPFYKLLYVQVLVAIAIGVALGYFRPDLGTEMKPLGEGFINLIKMIVAPVIFCTVVTGIAGMDDMKSVGKTGGYALGYFLAVSTLALFLGLVVINYFAPGVGMNIDATTLDETAVASYAEQAKNQTVSGFILDVIPKTVVGAFAEGKILQVLLFSLLFGFALNALGKEGSLVYDFIKRFSNVLFGIVGMIMRVAPIGAFGAMAYTIGAFGIKSLMDLGELMLCFYLTCVFFIVVVLGLIARVHGFSIFKFLRYIREELFIVLGTSSSESVLPRIINKMEALGCRKSVVGLVIPTGYSFNLDGTAIYLTMAAMFLAQATNHPMSTSDQLALLFVLMLTSKGAAAVTGGGFIVLAATLPAVSPVPIAALTLILGVDRFMSEARALTNLIGNGVATVVVAKWCKQIDEEKMREQLG
jgi:aerobic C4-dicarboxylate transport protein